MGGGFGVSASGARFRSPGSRYQGFGRAGDTVDDMNPALPIVRNRP